MAGLEDTVSKYIALRDKKAELMKAAKEQAAKIDAVLDKIEAALLLTFQQDGVQSVKTAAGTAYQASRTSATVADWDTVLAFIQARELWPMLEKRVSKDVVAQFKEETGELPPGVNWREELVLNVRRS